MITTFTNFERHRNINRFNPNSKFVLTGNRIDGRLNFDHEIFPDFKAVKAKLPKIIAELEYAGEWDVALYQVPYDFRFRKIWDYYRKPNRGICIFNYSYMAAQEHMVVNISEDKISFNGLSTYWGIENGNKRIEGFEVYESVYTVTLRQRLGVN
jgi:hypothetical protein